MQMKTVLDPRLFRHEQGKCWGLDLADAGLDRMMKGSLSPRIEVFEDGRKLGPANAIFEEICDTGYGRYALTRGRFYLSASDNSDPAANGREYLLAAEQHEDGTPLPPPRIMHVGITGACNLTCRICRTDNPGHENTLKDGCIDKLAAEVIPTLQELRLDAAGEPTLHKPKFRRFLAEAAKHGVPVFVCTNAALIDEEMADFIFGSSIKRIQISIDSPVRETLEWVRRGVAYDDLLRGVRHLVAARKRMARPDVVLNFHAALLRQNIEQLPDLVRLAHAEGIDQVSCMFGSIHSYMDFDWSVFWCRDLHNKMIDEAERVARDLGVTFRPWGRFDLDADPADTSLPPGEPMECYQLQHWTYVDPTGIVRPCCISSNHFLGDLNQDGFGQIWSGPHYAELRRTYASDQPSNPTCAKCYIRLGWNRNSYRSYFSAPLWPQVRERLGLPPED